MKRSIIAVIVAAASITSFNASAIVTGLNGVTSGKQADALNNAYGHSYTNAKSLSNQGATKAQMAKAGKQAQVAANNAMAAGLATAASQSYHKNDPTGTPRTAYANVNVSAKAPASYSVATPGFKGVKAVATHTTNVANFTNAAASQKALTASKMASSVAAPGAAPNTMDQGTKTNPAGVPGSFGVTAATAQANLTAGKMASATNPVGTAPNTMNPGVKTNPVGNPVAISSKPKNSSINMAASSLKPSTPVQVGNTLTTAGAIAKVNPNTQISVPTESVFGAPSRSNHSDRSNGSRSEGHQGRGSDNAHSHAFGGHGYGHDNSRSEGFGGHSHFH